MKKLYLLFFCLAIFSCKQQPSKQKAINTNLDDNNKISEEVEFKTTPDDLNIFILGDDEQIFAFPLAYIKSTRELVSEHLASLDSNMANLDEDIIDDAMFPYLLKETKDIVHTKVQEYKQSRQPQSTSLALTRRLPKKNASYWHKNSIKLQKGAIRKFEYYRDYRLNSTRKQDYFNKALAKKDADHSYSKFSPMDPLEIKDHPNSLNAKIFLGMAPNTSYLKNVSDEAGTSVNIMSIVEDFELTKTLERVGVDPKTAVKKNVHTYKNGRFSAQLHNLPSEKLNITDWFQYSTPDRTMMTSAIVRRAIDDLVTGMRQGKTIYIHCKSGKGRSASIVVGARAHIDLQNTLFKDSSKKISNNDIKEAIDKQIEEVKAKRKEVGISHAQRVNLHNVLRNMFPDNLID